MMTATASESAVPTVRCVPMASMSPPKHLSHLPASYRRTALASSAFTGRDTRRRIRPSASRKLMSDSAPWFGSAPADRGRRHRARLLIVKGHAQPVLPQKPGEGRPRHLEVAGLFCHLVGRIAGLDQIPCVDRLLAKDRPVFSPFDPALVSNKVKVRAGPGEPEEKVEGRKIPPPCSARFR